MHCPCGKAVTAIRSLCSASNGGALMNQPAISRLHRPALPEPGWKRRRLCAAQRVRPARLTAARAMAQTMVVGNHGRGTTAVFAIELQAVSPQAQHRRAYEIHVGPDLFGQLVVTIDF